MAEKYFFGRGGTYQSHKQGAKQVKKEETTCTKAWNEAKEN